MVEPQKTNASGEGGAALTKLSGGMNGSKNKLCGVKHTADIRRELHRAVLGLWALCGGDAQRTTLLLRRQDRLGTLSMSTVDLGGV
jgi:hypothetical protein